MISTQLSIIKVKKKHLYRIFITQENGEVTRWYVENSWGKMNSKDGHITMTTEWFKEYVFEVVVDKKILPKCVLDVYNLEPILLPIWDQLGNISFVN